MNSGRHHFFATALLVMTLLLGISSNVRSQGGVELGMAKPTAAPLNMDKKYNIIVIMTDDQRFDTIGFTELNTEIMNKYGYAIMPEVERLLVNQGVLFTNSFVTTPLCCPDRASLLSGGYYSHNTGVLSNEPPNGGATMFDDTETIATLLQQAGYKTGLIGKYLNNYPEMAPHIPPGWSKFVAVSNSKKKEALNWYDLDFCEGTSTATTPGTGEIYNVHDTCPGCPALDSRVYATNYITKKSIAFIRENSASPFFLFVADKAPHAPAIAEPEYMDLFPRYKYSLRAFGKERPTGTPKYKEKRKRRSNFLQGQLRSLQSIDHQVAMLVDELTKLGILDRTIIAFTSDNGMMWGEHLTFGKAQPFEESIRVPLVIRFPGVVPHTEDALVASNLDLGKTILSVAGISKNTDGEDLVPLLTQTNSAWRDRLNLEELAIDGKERRFVATRTTKWKYVEFATGDALLYDLDKDPYEETNNIADPKQASVLNDLKSELNVFKQKLIAITSPALLPSGVVGKPYEFKLEAWGTPKQWRIFEGSLPLGLSLDESTGTISGTPQRAGKKKVGILLTGTGYEAQTGRPQQSSLIASIRIKKNKR